ncbi:penicillin-binding protein 2, partial [Candidatus Uhrbacteria bacterium]|nr:penicillin-binding protein 2 [Candidatus Uhrbacteria bacterium]
MPRHSHDPIDLAPASVQPVPNSERVEYIGRAASSRRITIAFLALLAVAGLLMGRSVDIQVIRQQAFVSAAEQNRIREEILVPVRGVLVDRNGVPLVRNIPSYAIGVVPADLDVRTTNADIRTLATAIGMAEDELRATLARYPSHLTEPIVVRDGLSYDAAARLLVASASPATQLLVQERRDYRGPDGRDLESLSHVLGFVGRVDAEEYRTRAPLRYRPSDLIGKAGIESSYEASLRGHPGIRRVTIDARGRIASTSAFEPPAAGVPVTMTIDRALQAAAERSLRAGLRASGSRRGAAVAIDPVQGEILALVSLPAFSSSALVEGMSLPEYQTLVDHPDHPLFPRAIAGTYPSGSAIKPAIAAAALSAGVITSQTRIHSTGGIAVEGSFFPDWRAGGHGWVDVREAIAQSVNTYFYLIGGGKPRAAPPSMPGPSQERALGPQSIERGLRAFGFGQPTGVDIAGDAAGLIPTPEWKERTRNEPWYIGDTYHLAIGQGDLLITPLQLAVATAAFANEGYRVTPHLVRDRFSPSLGEGEREGEGTSAPSRISGITDEAIQTVRQGMRMAVTGGSAQGLADLPFPVAGKTGTAQTIPNRRPHAWFTGWAEYPQTPKTTRPSS